MRFNVRVRDGEKGNGTIIEARAPSESLVREWADSQMKLWGWSSGTILSVEEKKEEAES